MSNNRRATTSRQPCVVAHTHHMTRESGLYLNMQINVFKS
jgi:hypothetical protein